MHSCILHMLMIFRSALLVNAQLGICPVGQQSVPQEQNYSWHMHDTGVAFRAPGLLKAVRAGESKCMSCGHVDRGDAVLR
jgi:hypothetical protein